jgi:hypothetical protein
VTVIIVAVLPATTVLGEIELIAGVGVGGGVGVEEPEPPLEQPETHSNADTQIAAIHPPFPFRIRGSVQHQGFVTSISLP